MRRTSPEVPRDWEGLVGGKWALWVGAFSLFLSVACFLGYTWNAVWSHLPPPTPAEKTAMGFAWGLGLMILGGFLRGRTQRWYSEGLTGAGLGIAYLSLWAGAEHFHILGFIPAFGAMAALTSLGVVLAVRYRTMNLSLLSTALGFLTPMLLKGSGESGSAVGFLVYIALLDGGVLAVSLFRRWRPLSSFSFVLTVIAVWVWAGETDLGPIRLVSWFFFSLYAFLFITGALYDSLARRQETGGADLVLFIAAGTCYAVTGEVILSPLLTALPSAFLLGLTSAFALLALRLNRLAPANRMLLFSAQGLALSALTLAVPVQLRESGLQAVAWTVESALLVLTARRRDSPLIRATGRLVWLLATFSVAMSWLDAHVGWHDVLTTADLKPHLLLLNNGALPLLVAVAGAYFMALSGWEPGDGAAAKDSFVPLYASYAAFGGAWLVAQEAALGCLWEHYPTAAETAAGAVFLGSALVAVYALVIFAVAARNHHRTLYPFALWIALGCACAPWWAALGGVSPGGFAFWNLRFAATIVVTLVLAALEHLRRTTPLETDSGTFFQAIWPALCAAFPLAGATVELGCALSRGQAVAGWGPDSFFAVAALWALAGPLAVIMGRRQDDFGLRVIGYFSSITAAMIWICTSVTHGPSGAPGANLPFFAGLGTALGCALTGRLMARRGPGFHEEEGAVSPLFTVVATGLALWVLSGENRYAFWVHHEGIGPHWEVISYFGLALLWTAFATGLLGWGCLRRETLTRFLATMVYLVGASIFLLAALGLEAPLWHPLGNPRFPCYLLIAALWGLGALLLHCQGTELPPAERKLPLCAAAGAVALLLAGVSQELFESCRWYAETVGPYWGNLAWYLIAMLWQGTALAAFIAGAAQGHVGLRVVSYWLSGAALMVLLANSLSASRLNWTPLLNPRFLAFLVAANALGVFARLLRKNTPDVRHPVHGEIQLLLPISLLAVVVLGWGLTQEAYETAFTFRVLLGGHWERVAQVGISGVWSAYAAALLAAGVLRPNRPQRLLALGLLCATVIKVFVFDLAFLDGPLRILALGGLGISLLFISWLYSRFGLEKRRATTKPEVWRSASS